MEDNLRQSSLVAASKQKHRSPVQYFYDLRWQGRRIDWSAYVFILPFGIAFFLFSVLAIFFALYISFTEWGIYGDPKWVGLANFTQMTRDSWVPKVWGNTLRYALMVVPSTTILALVVAIFVNQRWPGYTLARITFYSPRVVSVTVVGLIWVWMYDTQFGVINQYLNNWFGIPNIPWLTSPRWVLQAVAVTAVWWEVGFYMVILLAALQDVPQSLREAARVDGANGLQVFWYIIVPHLRPAISLVITIEIIRSLRAFSQMYIMTGGGPAGASTSVIYYIFQKGWTEYELGYASALSMVLFATILIVTIIQLRVFRETNE